VSLQGLLAQTVSVGRRSFDGTGSQGIPTAGTTTWSDHPGRLEQTAVTDSIRDGDVVLADWELFLLPDVAIDTLDLVVVDAVTYEVAAPPVVARSPAGPHHLVVRLIRRAPVRPDLPGGS
jgi:hypothetical protein